MRLSTAAWLKPWLLDLKKVILGSSTFTPPSCSGSKPFRKYNPGGS